MTKYESCSVRVSNHLHRGQNDVDRQSNGGVIANYTVAEIIAQKMEDNWQCVGVGPGIQPGEREVFFVRIVQSILDRTRP